MRNAYNSYPLAIFAPQIGARSETFIRRHVQDLLPDRTVAVVGTAGGGYAGHWSVASPVLALDTLKQTSASRLARGVLRRMGLTVPNPSEKEVERFLKRHKVQVILGEFLNLSLTWLPVAEQLGIRFFGHAHGFDVSALLREARWRAEYLRYNQSSGVITMSHVSRKRLAELGITESKLHVVPYGVDVLAEPRNRSPREVVRCLAVGRMVAKKAPILTLDAYRRAAESCPELRLDFVGDGVLLPAARQFVQAFDLGNRVTLHGGRPNEVVQRLMNDADIFVQHSMTDPETGDEEGLPVAILEAMAQGLPVISTRHAGIPEAVVDGATGYLVNEGDSVAMADRMVALARNHGLRQQFGQAGWQRAKECFTWERERTDLLRILNLDTWHREARPT